MSLRRMFAFASHTFNPKLWSSVIVHGFPPSFYLFISIAKTVIGSARFRPTSSCHNWCMLANFYLRIAQTACHITIWPIFAVFTTRQSPSSFLSTIAPYNVTGPGHASVISHVSTARNVVRVIGFETTIFRLRWGKCPDYLDSTWENDPVNARSQG